MVEQKATNITWQDAAVSGDARAKLMGHKGAIIWLTGLSGSGKSTLTVAVEQALYNRGCHTYILDGDNVRHGLNKDLGFSPEDRHENIRRIGEVASLFADAGLIALTAFISPYIADRNTARNAAGNSTFIEAYCDCPLDICEQRDPRGLYKRARAGDIKQFTGIDAPYEAPPKPELVVPTGSETVQQCVARIMAYLEQAGIIPAQ